MANLSITRNNGTQVDLDIEYQLEVINEDFMTDINEALANSSGIEGHTKQAEAFDPSKTYEAGEIYCDNGVLTLVTYDGTKPLTSNNLLNPEILVDIYGEYFVGASYA